MHIRSTGQSYDEDRFQNTYTCTVMCLGMSILLFCYLFFFPSIRFLQPTHIIMLNSLLSSLLKVYCKSDVMHMCTSA